MLFKMKVVLTYLLTAELGSALALNTSFDIYSQAASIPWSPKAPSSVDQSAVYNHTYYLSDRTNGGVRPIHTICPPLFRPANQITQVHVVSLVNNTQTSLITGFVTGYANRILSSTVSGPDGLVVLPDRNELWVGDGDGTVKVISLISNTIIANISTGSKKRADELAYDPVRSTVVVTNPNEAVPYVSVISAVNRTVLGKIMFPNVTELEQPAFNAVTGVFYVSVPSSGKNPGGSICTLDIGSMSISATYPLPDCVPAGIVFGPNQHLFIGCSESQITDYGYAASYVMDTSSNGTIIAKISGLAGIDQVAYDPAANLYYASAYQYLLDNTTARPFVAIINASSNTLVQSITTDNLTAHSVAADLNTGAMVVPIAKQGIVVYRLKSSIGGSNGSSSTSVTVATPIATYAGAAVSWYPVISIAIAGAAASAVFCWV